MVLYRDIIPMSIPSTIVGGGRGEEGRREEEEVPREVIELPYK